VPQQPRQAEGDAVALRTAENAMSIVSFDVNVDIITRWAQSLHLR
jgi:hypothetical protein